MASESESARRGVNSLPATLNSNVHRLTSSRPRRVRSFSIVEESPNWPDSNDVGCEAPCVSQPPLTSIMHELMALDIRVPPPCRTVFMTEENPVSRYMSQQTTLNRKSTSGALRCASAGGNVPCESVPIHLPLKHELDLLPQALAIHLQKIVTAAIQEFLYPLALMRSRRRWRERLIAEQEPSVPRLTVDYLATIPLFSGWPQPSLSAVVSAVKLRCYEANEIVVYDREPSSFMLFFVSGTAKRVAVVPTGVRSSIKRAQSVKSLFGGSNVRGNRHHKSVLSTSHNTILHAPQVLGDLNLLTEELWSGFFKANTRCDFFVLPKLAFSAILDAIPPNILTVTIRTAFQRRNEAMSEHFPMDAYRIREYPIFSETSVEFAQGIADRLQPNAVPKNFILSKEREPCTSMLFLMHGTVGLYRKGDSSGSVPATTDVLVKMVEAPAILNDSSLAHGSDNEHTIRSATDSDLYLLSTVNLTSLTRQFSKDFDTMLDAARAQRQTELASNYSHYKAIVQSVPLLGRRIPYYRVKDFLLKLQSKSYRPLSSVCSTASFCDRIIIVVKGKMKVGTEQFINMGECIGWTCCVPHRWSHVVMTVKATTEVLEMSYLDVMTFMDSCGALSAVTHETKMMMFPRAFPKQRVELLKAALPLHVALYPVSRSPLVNLNEVGFCTVHMSALAEAEAANKAKDEEERKPPVFKKLSQGVWIPLSSKVRGFSTIGK